MKNMLKWLVYLSVFFVSGVSFADSLKVKLKVQSVGFGDYNILGNVNGDFSDAEKVNSMVITFSNISTGNIELSASYGSFVSTIGASPILRVFYNKQFAQLAASYLQTQEAFGNESAAVFRGSFQSKKEKIRLIGASSVAKLIETIPSGEYSMEIVGKDNGNVVLQAAGKVNVVGM